MVSDVELKGLNVLVTGGAAGLGRTIVETLHSRGATVCQIDRGEAPSEFADVGVRSRGADVSDEAQVEEAVAWAVAEMGTVDVLVNNAGISGVGGPKRLHETDLAEFRSTVDVNLIGLFLVTRAALRGMVARGSGTIVNVASIGGVTALKGRAPYCATKAGVVMLTKSLAAEYATDGIRANAVCPGWIDTPMVRWRLEQPDGGKDVLAQVPLGRVAATQEIADVVAFLAGPGASFMTGSAVLADGGMTSALR